MLKLTIYHSGNNGNQARLRKNTKISFKYQNPMFGEAGLFSYLIKVNRDENNYIFNYAGSMDSVEAKNLTFKLEIGTDVLAEGDVVLTDGTGDKYIEFYLKSGSSSVAYFLQNTLMYNTSIWGSHDYYGIEEETLNGIFPDYPICVPSIYNEDDDYINNEYDPDAGVIIKQTPAVYVRYLLNKLISGLGFVKENDALAAIPDANRLALWSPVYNTSASIRHCLPAIYIQDFLDDLKARFNISVFFSPFNYVAEIINIADCLLLEPTDWDDNFKSWTKNEDPEEKELLFTQEAADSDDDILSENDLLEELEDDNVTLHTVADWEALQNESYSSTVYVESLKRYFKSKTVDPGNSLYVANTDSANYEKMFVFSNDTEEYPVDSATTDEQTYYKVDYWSESDFEEEIINASTDADTENLIAQFIFPDLEGEITKSFGFQAYLNVLADSSYLISRLFVINKAGDSETEIGYNAALVSNTSKLLTSISFEVSQDAELLPDSDSAGGNDANRLVLRLYSKSEYSGAQIELNIGAYWLSPSYVYIDPPMEYWREINMLADYRYNEYNQDKEDADGYDALIVDVDPDPDTTFKPNSILSKNELVRMQGYLCEMPVTSLSKKSSSDQNDFEYVLFRGMRRDEQEGLKYAPYANFDILDLNKEDYSNKLLDPVTPSLTLAWHGEKGLIQQFWKNRLYWESYFKRGAQCELELSVNDIINHKIYKPFKVDGVRCVIDVLSFDINENGDVDNCKADVYIL